MKSRKINKAKRIDVSCCNNGSCEYCKNSRTYSNKHREPVLLSNNLLEAAVIEYEDFQDNIMSNPFTGDEDNYLF